MHQHQDIFLRLPQIIGNPRANPPIPALIPVGKTAWWGGIKRGAFPKPIGLPLRLTYSGLTSLSTQQRGRTCGEKCGETHSEPLQTRMGLDTLAEAVRFELTNGFPLPVFKTGAIDHSATPPQHPRL